MFWLFVSLYQNWHFFRVFQSTESVLLKVTNNILLDADSSGCSVLPRWICVLSDTVSHDLLIGCLEHCAGVKGMVPNWFQSYVKQWAFSLENTLPHQLLRHQEFHWGLSWILFFSSFFFLFVHDIICQHNIPFTITMPCVGCVVTNDKQKWCVMCKKCWNTSKCCALEI